MKVVLKGACARDVIQYDNVTIQCLCMFTQVLCVYTLLFNTLCFAR